MKGEKVEGKMTKVISVFVTDCRSRLSEEEFKVAKNIKKTLKLF